MYLPNEIDRLTARNTKQKKKETKNRETPWLKYVRKRLHRIAPEERKREREEIDFVY
jgi:hypothetical protein